MAQLKENVQAKKRLAYIPERAGTNGIAKEEFFELARNYILSIELETEEHIDISRIFSYMLLKAYYNTDTDSIHSLAPFLRFLFDDKHEQSAVTKMARATYLYRDIRILAEQCFPLVTTPRIINKLLDMIDIARKEEYRTKISGDRAINWQDKADSKKGT